LHSLPCRGNIRDTRAEVNQPCPLFFIFPPLSPFIALKGLYDCWAVNGGAQCAAKLTVETVKAELFGAKAKAQQGYYEHEYCNCNKSDAKNVNR
jgi:hypothetical protein